MMVHAGPSGSTIEDAREAVGTVDDALRALVVRAGGANAWVVLGPLRGADDGEHDRVGRLVAQLGIYHLLAVGDGARVLFAASRSEGLRPEEAVFVASTADAIAYLRDNLEPGAALLVAGTGLDAIVASLLEDAQA